MEKKHKLEQEHDDYLDKTHQSIQQEKRSFMPNRKKSLLGVDRSNLKIAGVETGKRIEAKNSIDTYNKNVIEEVNKTGNHYDKILVDPGNTSGEIEEALGCLEKAIYQNSHSEDRLIWYKVSDKLPKVEQEVLLITKFGANKLGYLLPLDEEYASVDPDYKNEWAIAENIYEHTHYENDFIVFWAEINKPDFDYLTHD